MYLSSIDWYRGERKRLETFMVKKPSLYRHLLDQGYGERELNELRISGLELSEIYQQSLENGFSPISE
jgi:hypothetical protein